MNDAPAIHTGPIAVRAYAPRHTHEPFARPSHDDELVCVLDTETTTDASQRLMFGSARVYRGERLLHETLFHADDLPASDVATLRRYVDEHAADNGHPLRLMSRSVFVEQVIWKVVYEARALLVGHNLAFDLSRIAVRSVASRKGGFSLQLWESVDAEGKSWRHKYRPNVTIQSFGSKRQFLAFTKPWDIDRVNLVERKHGYAGRFLDTHMASSALTDRSLSLQVAAEVFGLDGKVDPGGYGHVTEQHIDYGRQDVRTTFALYRALVAEWSRHPVDAPLGELYSGATVGKRYLEAMGITPPRRRAPAVSDAVLGQHMVAYHGARAECRIRGVPMPVRYVDLTSQYPTVFALMGLWRYVVARALRVEDATDHARGLLETVTRESLLDPATWPRLATVICRVRPDGELLPARAKYGALGDDDAGVAWTIGLNHLHADEDLWFTLADLVVAKLLGGRAPDVLEARRIVPVGTMDGLRSVALRGSVPVDPGTDDFFRLAITERQRIRRGPPSAEAKMLERFLKLLANSTSYGVFAEFRTLPTPARGKRVQVFGLDVLDVRVRTEEEAGVYCFPPFAATITGGGRLLLALLQAGVEARDGTYVGCDTDGMLFVASPSGGLVPCPGGTHRTADGQEAVYALSDAEVREVLDEFDTLNPYDPAVVPHLVKVEDENHRKLDEDTVDHDQLVELYALQLSSKRYALFERRPDGPLLRKTSKHGLGMYLPPPGENRDSWVDGVWERFVREAEGLPAQPDPDWYKLPAISQLTVSTPHVLSPFRHMNKGRPYADQVKPYNFMLVGHRDPDPTVLGPDGVNEKGIVPIAPYTTDPDELHDLQWLDRSTGEPIAVATEPDGRLGHVRLMTYRDAIAAHRRHPEHKSGDPDGGRGTSVSVGLLPRLTVHATEVRHIGKESNRLEEEEAGSLDDADSPYVDYRDPKREWRLQAERLRALRKELGAAEFRRRVGLPERTIRYALNQAGLPRRQNREALLHELDANLSLW